jgi:chemotaxis protein MotB
MDDMSQSKQSEDSGAPAWVMTFADLMSLLMCFFVLLLSFSEMDVLKFKQIAGSMKMAFGVQRDVEFKMIPKGTSVVTREFSPGRPTPTPLQEMRQHTTDDTKNSLDFTDSLSKKTKQIAAQQLQEEARQRLATSADNLRAILREEIRKGLLEIKTQDDEVVIRIREKGSFPSGRAALRKNFLPVLKKIGTVLNDVEGKIIVAGHTDDVPIATRLYPSNWLLSSARAATVVHYLHKYAHVSPSRMQIRAHADTQSIAPNKTAANRAKNRRVEIIVRDKNWTPGAVPDPTQIVELSE